jgi:hypothetical protein
MNLAQHVVQKQLLHPANGSDRKMTVTVTNAASTMQCL